MSPGLQRARELLTLGAPIANWCWLDPQGRWTQDPAVRSMLRMTFRVGSGFTSARVHLEDVDQLRELLPAEIFA